MADAADHSIFIGGVQACRTRRDRKPLVYFRSELGTIDDPGSHVEQELSAWQMSL